MAETKNIMIVGVGGQGTLLTSRILGGITVEAGYDVKLSEVHGMAQRGGSVVTYVRYGEKVAEPIVEEGQADVLIAFERLEALRYAHFLKKDGVIIVNDQRIDPMPVVTGVANKDVTSTSSASAISFYYNDNMSVGDIFYISSPKVEEGDKASPWCTTCLLYTSPSPRDCS